MATGDTNDILTRLRSNVPPWFPSQGTAPVVDAILTGIAATFANIYSLLIYARAQARIPTATGAWLDMIAWDFFGGRFLRFVGESDADFSARIMVELIRPRLTRSAIQAALEALTGFPVRIIEAWYPTDTGVIDRLFLDVDVAGAPNRIGDAGLHCQFFIECVLPLNQPLGANAMPAIDVNLYIDTPPTGFIMDFSALQTGQSNIYSFINALRAAGITAWVRFVPPPTVPMWDQPGATWDANGATWDSPAAAA